MGSSELSLDLNPSHNPLRMISGFFRNVSMIKDPSKRLSKVQEFLKSLEEERKKIDAFKRELPYCMVLINEAIEAVEEEEKKCRSLAEKATPVLEEFMPVKSKLDEDRGVDGEKDNRDKMNWMSSVQLWSDTNEKSNKSKAMDDLKEKTEELKQWAQEKSFLLCKNKNNGGAFTPFKGTSSGLLPLKEEKEVFRPPGISLLSPRIKNPNADSGVGKSGGRVTEFVSSSVAAAMNIQSNSHPPPPPQQQQQIARKQRRCWSPELHRRFLSALNELGGSQVATPKQIRELMKVDGLTNDEVKSHLQKYRLHTRRLPASAPGTANPEVLVMGGMRGLWVPNVHYKAAKQSTSQSGSPQGPLQLSGTSRGISTTGGESGEDEDGKSESNSWKSHLGSGDEETESQ